MFSTGMMLPDSNPILIHNYLDLSVMDTYSQCAHHLAAMSTRSTLPRESGNLPCLQCQTSVEQRLYQPSLNSVPSLLKNTLVTTNINLLHYSYCALYYMQTLVYFRKDSEKKREV